MRTRRTLEQAYKHIKSKFANLSKNDIFQIIEKTTKYQAKEIILNPTYKISWMFNVKFWLISRKIKKKIPLSYILSNRHFYGLSFYVNKNVLIPRQESELIVDYAIEFTNKRCNLNVLDLCSGSGCLGISLLKNSFDRIDNVTFSDISKKANKVCIRNLKNFELLQKSKVINGDFIEPFKNKTKFDVILCNPPYIDFNDSDLDPNVKEFEPTISLFAKEKGLYFYKELILNLDSLIRDKNNFIVIMEIGWNQKSAIESILSETQWIKWDFKKDYSNNWRNLILTSIGE